MRWRKISELRHDPALARTTSELRHVMFSDDVVYFPSPYTLEELPSPVLANFVVDGHVPSSAWRLRPKVASRKGGAHFYVVYAADKYGAKLCGRDW